MASIQDGYNAIVRHLQAMPSRPNLVYPDSDLGADLPRIVIQYVKPAQRFFSHDGLTDGLVQVAARIETATGSYTANSKSYIDAIQEHFDVGTKLENLVTIVDKPSPEAYVQVGPVFQVTIMITGAMIF